MRTISLIMPTYNRAFIIELAILSIIHQKEHAWNIELLIGDDGDDNTEALINNIPNTNSKLTIKYFKMKRTPLSDKFNFLIKQSKGEFYGLIGSDDIQSAYKIVAFERAYAQNPNASVFGQRAFIYHDIVYDFSNLWTQNRDLSFFKAGSFVIVDRKLFDKVGGYKPGLWKRVDRSLYKKTKRLKPIICDVSRYDERIIESSIALQHLDNIWGRKSKGLDNNKPIQLANFYAEPVKIDIKKNIPEFFNVYTRIHQNLVSTIKSDYCVDSKTKLLPQHFNKLNILMVISLDISHNNGASNIRPAKILRAFQSSAHHIQVIFAPTRSKQRRNIIKRIIIDSVLRKQYDICYYEPSTFPLQKTERLLIKWLKWKKTWISFFHRDMYWRYGIGINTIDQMAIKKHVLKQENNLQFLRSTINQFFVPTQSYGQHLSNTFPTLPLPPAGEKEEIHYDIKSRHGAIYVGGISQRYGLNLLLESFKIINKQTSLPLSIICRKKDYDANYKTIVNYLDSQWLHIKHLTSSELASEYKHAKLAIIPIIKNDYHALAMPYKLFEYASHGLPVAVSDNYEQAKLVEENGIGINIGSTVDSFVHSLQSLHSDNTRLVKMHQNSIHFIEKDGLWSHRIQRIIRTFRESNE